MYHTTISITYDKCRCIFKGLIYEQCTQCKPAYIGCIISHKLRQDIQRYPALREEVCSNTHYINSII